MRRLLGLTLVLALLPTASAQAETTWKQLRRPLQLPNLQPGAACPVSTVDRRIDWRAANIFGGSGIGRGPAYPGLSSGRLLTRPRGEWFRGKLFWYVAPGYRGRVLARGHRLDARGPLRLDGERRELRIERGRTVMWSGQPRGSRGVPTSALVKAAGCYGVQLDGTRFSRTVVFEVTVEPPIGAP